MDLTDLKFSLFEIICLSSLPNLIGNHLYPAELTLSDSASFIYLFSYAIYCILLINLLFILLKFIY